MGASYKAENDLDAQPLLDAHKGSHLPRAVLSFQQELSVRGTAALCERLTACASGIRPAATPRL